MKDTVARVDGHALSVADLLQHARVTGGQEFVERAIDNHLIWREVERRGVAVSSRDIDETFARSFPSRTPESATPSEREAIRKTVAFGKLKRVVAQELLGVDGPALLARLDRQAHAAMLDVLFLFWLRETRRAAAIDIHLDTLLAEVA
jgi:hypothetical protein